MTVKTVRVAAAVIEHDEHILAAQRSYGEFAGGWEFPGGKIEKDETPWEACVRELHEELEIEIADGKHLCTVDYDYPTFHLTMECFTCRIAAGTPRLHAHSHLRWLPQNELGAVDWLPADVAVVEALADRRP